MASVAGNHRLHVSMAPKTAIHFLIGPLRPKLDRLRSLVSAVLHDGFQNSHPSRDRSSSAEALQASVAGDCRLLIDGSRTAIHRGFVPPRLKPDVLRSPVIPGYVSMAPEQPSITRFVFSSEAQHASVLVIASYIRWLREQPSITRSVPFDRIAASVAGDCRLYTMAFTTAIHHAIVPHLPKLYRLRSPVIAGYILMASKQG